MSLAELFFSTRKCKRRLLAAAWSGTVHGIHINLRRPGVFPAMARLLSGLRETRPLLAEQRPTQRFAKWRHTMSSWFVNKCLHLVIFQNQKLINYGFVYKQKFRFMQPEQPVATSRNQSQLRRDSMKFHEQSINHQQISTTNHEILCTWTMCDWLWLVVTGCDWLWPAIWRRWIVHEISLNFAKPSSTWIANHSNILITLPKFVENA